MPSPLDVAMFTAPALLAAALAWLVRRRGLAASALVFLASYPVLWVVITALTLLISFQVFGVDLID
jgi:hypothetical protein